MRRIYLFGTFMLLVGAVYFLWQYRFQRSSEYPTFRLADLRAGAQLQKGAEWVETGSGPMLKIHVDSAHRNVVALMNFPSVQAVDYLHVRFKVAARGLEPGREVWEDGRCIIDWHPPEGGAPFENDPVTSSRHDYPSVMTELVMRPDRGPAIPSLRVENLGRVGDFEIQTFEATVLKERMAWTIGKFLVPACWLVWIVFLIGPGGKYRLVRSVATACVWLLMGFYFVVPGPWKALRSFGEPFQIGSELIVPSSPVAPVKATPQVTNPETGGDVPEVKSVGKIPEKGNFTLRLKTFAAKAKSLLHVALLFAPTLLTALLVGRRPALVIAVLFSFCVEAAQIAFGFGADFVDVIDLLNDAAGIALAFVFYQILRKKFPLLQKI